MGETAVEVTTSGIFEEAGIVMVDFLELAGNFFIGLWNNPMGKIICVLGLISAAVSLAYRLFLRRKHV